VVVVIVANIAFLVMRSLMKHKIEPVIDVAPELQTNSSVDTLMALRSLNNSFCNSVQPFLIACLIWMLPDEVNNEGALAIAAQRKLFLISSFTAFVFATPYMFISISEGPAWWIKIGPKVYASFIAMIYVIWPLFDSFYTFFIIIGPPKLTLDYYSSWNIMYTTL
jgi:hypothetical protein